MKAKPAGPKAARVRSAAPGKKPRPASRMLQEKLDTFIEFLARTGSVTAAADQAGLARTHLYERRRTHVRFAAAWKKALALGVDSLHDDAMRRALQGDERAIVRGGELVATERRHNDRLVQFLLKAHKPEFSGSAPAVSLSEQAEMARALKAARKRLAAHVARENARTVAEEKPDREDKEGNP